MTKKQRSSADPDRLRRKTAERVWEERRAAGEVPSRLDAERLVHELQVHQIELEMQNDELQRARAEVEEGLARYTDLYELAPVGYFSLDPDGTILQSNLAGARLLRRERSSLVGTRLLVHVAPTSRSTLEAFLKKAFAGETTELCEVTVGGDGAPPQWLNLTGTSDDGRCRVVATDVTERKRAGELLAIRGELYAQAEALGQAGLLQKMLSEACRITGSRTGFCYAVDPEQALSLEAWFGAEPVATGLEDCVAQRLVVVHNGSKGRLGKQRELLVPLVRKDRVVALVGVGDKALDFSERDVETVASLADVAWDIREQMQAEVDRKSLQAQLMQAQKMEAIGTLAGGIAHEFNNVLAGVLAGLSLLELDLGESGTHAESIREMKSLVERAAELTKRLLGFARRGKYDVRPLDLARIVESTSVMFRHTHTNVVFESEFELDLRAVLMDHTQLEQVLLNIFANAAQAMPNGGRVRVHAANVELRAEETARSAGRYVKVTISDTGSGMSAATRSRVFEPFFTTKPRGTGTGLGLASVYGILEGHGGFASVESELGEGTTFTLFLPATDRPAVPERSAAEAVRPGRETILVVDDEELLVRVTGRLLGKMGYEVLTATSGERAIEIFRAHRDEIAIVILDMVMPEMGGSQVFDALREIAPDVKVLLSSGYSVEGQAQEILARGCNGFIQKPYDAAKLSAELRKLM